MNTDNLHNDTHAIIERTLVSYAQPPFVGQLSALAWARDPKTGTRFWIAAHVTDEIARNEDMVNRTLQEAADAFMNEGPRERKPRWACSAWYKIFIPYPADMWRLRKNWATVGSKICRKGKQK